MFKNELCFKLPPKEKLSKYIEQLQAECNSKKIGYYHLSESMEEVVKKSKVLV